MCEVLDHKVKFHKHWFLEFFIEECEGFRFLCAWGGGGLNNFFNVLDIEINSSKVSRVREFKVIFHGKMSCK